MNDVCSVWCCSILLKIVVLIIGESVKIWPKEMFQHMQIIVLIDTRVGFALIKSISWFLAPSLFAFILLCVLGNSAIEPWVLNFLHWSKIFLAVGDFILGNCCFQASITFKELLNSWYFLPWKFAYLYHVLAFKKKLNEFFACIYACT